MATQLSVYVLYNSSHWKASRCNSAVTGRQKKCTRKRDHARAELLFCLFKLLLF